MKTIFFIGYLMLLVALAKCNGKETKTICISDNMNDCIFEEVSNSINFNNINKLTFNKNIFSKVKSKRDISTFLNSIHPSFMKKMDRLSDKKECTTKMCLINNLFKLANSNRSFTT